ncbi:hypothetical protein HPB50_005272 [Hyalomma asiaticum]|uniref:Uncharacterized protein n=1 Tax=Hyalomma asiaticum TaxID=266040 RepID=A0ACB7T3K9_HYAAI|nr:hypothetical protein HPB50_005272 [Hyalomma asiaticum]
MVLAELIVLVRLVLHVQFIFLVLLIIAALIDATDEGYGACRQLLGAVGLLAIASPGRPAGRDNGQGDSTGTEHATARVRHPRSYYDGIRSWLCRRLWNMTRCGRCNDDNGIAKPGAPSTPSTSVPQPLLAGQSVDESETKESDTDKARPPSSSESREERPRSSLTDDQQEVPVGPSRAVLAEQPADASRAASSDQEAALSHIGAEPAFDVKHERALCTESDSAMPIATHPAAHPPAMDSPAEAVPSTSQGLAYVSPHVAGTAPAMASMAISPLLCQSATALLETSVGETFSSYFTRSSVFPTANMIQARGTYPYNTPRATWQPLTPPATPDTSGETPKDLNGGICWTPKCATCGKYYERVPCSNRVQCESRQHGSGGPRICWSCQVGGTKQYSFLFPSPELRKRTSNYGRCRNFDKSMPCGDPSICMSCQAGGTRKWSALLGSPELTRRTPKCGRCEKFYKIVPFGYSSTCEPCRVGGPDQRSVLLCRRCEKLYKVVRYEEPSTCESCQTGGTRQSSVLFGSPELPNRTPYCDRCGKFFKVAPYWETKASACLAKWVGRNK